MNVVIRDLKATLARLTAELKSDETALVAAQSKRDTAAGLVEHYEAVISHQEKDLGDSPAEYVPADVLRNQMERILDSSGNPLHYREIHTRLLADGFKVRGDDPVKNVGAHLSADRRFAATGQGKWGLTKWKTKTPPAPGEAPAERVGLIERLMRPVPPPRPRIARVIPPVDREIGRVLREDVSRPPTQN